MSSFRCWLSLCGHADCTDFQRDRQLYEPYTGAILGGIKPASLVERSSSPSGAAPPKQWTAGRRLQERNGRAIAPDAPRDLRGRVCASVSIVASSCSLPVWNKIPSNFRPRSFSMQPRLFRSRRLTASHQPRRLAALPLKWGWASAVNPWLTQCKRRVRGIEVGAEHSRT